MSEFNKDENPFDDPDFMSFMMSMKKLSHDRMMEMSYDLLINNAQSAVLHDAPPEDKIRAIDKVILYFEKNEEYEKCAKLVQIREQLENKF
tara:strand:- start:4252 stop:4524 length:273 start_codon:yes stop_codon:yes gene_type:complete